MFVMPAFIRLNEQQAFYSVKCLGVFEKNNSKGLSSRQGSILLFDGETGETLAMLDAEPITYYRTAAMSAVATKLLARHSSKNLAIVGTGHQAQHHLKAMLTVRPINSVKIVGRDFTKTKTIATSLQSELGVRIQAFPTVAEAVYDADIIVTATSAAAPVLKYDWIKAGAHINSIGGVKPDARELDDGIIQNGKLFVDSANSVKKETGDWLIPFEKGLINEQTIVAEIGDLFLQPKIFNRQEKDISVFKSVGLSIEDLVMAQYVYQEFLKK
jgi:ornithine cyclodeaminase